VASTPPEARRVTNRYVRCGASPRGAQALLLGGKVKALSDGRYNVSYKDIQEIATLALRHRLLLNFEAEADRVDPDAIVKEILEKTPTQPMAAVGV
jgi:MoxR-like ATPase